MNATTPNFKLKRIAAAVAAACVGSSVPQALAQQIITDGRTQTTLNVNGKVTDVRTSTIIGNNAFNSFSKFDVYAGNTVNLHVPTSATNLLNLIHDYRSHINGVLNSVKDGRIGGNVFFANPHGIVVGAGGVINTGSLTLLTPPQGFMDDFFTPSGDPSAAATQAMLTGTVPVSDSGMVVVRGRINAREAIRIAAGNVISTGSILSGAEFRGAAPDFSDIVNVNGLETGAQMVARNGAIEIVASHDIEVGGGRIASEGGNGVDGGKVTLRAAGNITVSGDGTISSRGRGANSSAGDILVFADGTAVLAGDAVIDARGGDVSGDGGFIEFSAQDKVRVEGGRFLAGAHAGQAGSILIDPNDIELVSLNQFTDGADFSLVANESITIASGVIISTRQVAGGADHLVAASTGNSGNLSLKAEHITLEDGAKLLAHADGGFTGGDVTLAATSINAIGADRTADASITATNATIKGRNITLSATADTSRIVQLLETVPGVTLEDAQTFFNNEVDDLSDGPGGEYLAVKTDATARTVLKGVDIEGSGAVKISAMAAARAGFEKKAVAEVTIEDGAAASRIKGQTVDISSKSDTSLTFNVLGTALRLADQSWLPAEDSGEVQLLNEQLFDFSGVPLVSLSESTARTTISGASIVEANDALNVSSEAVGAAKPTFASPLLISAAWGESEATAETAIKGTTHLIAGGKAAVTASTDVEVNVTATLNSTNKPFDAVFVVAQNEATTTAIVEGGASITAGSIDVAAKTTVDISAGAIAKNMGGSGAGFAVAVNLSETTTTATLGGNAAATSGDVTVSATTDIAKNNTSAESAVLGNPNTMAAKIANFQAGIQRNVATGILGAIGKTSPSTNDKLANFMFPGIKAGKFNLSGAVAYSDATNTATASIAPAATVKAEGNLSVTSKISDRPNASVGAKSTSTGTAIGGSAVIGSFTNNSNAFIGKDATVDAKGALLVDAQTHVPYPWEIDWNSPAAILNHLQDGILDLVLTNYAINSAKGKDGLGLAAAVNVFSLENNSSASIDEGAKVNTVFDKDTMTLPDQSVTVHAKNDVNTVNAVGILSKKFLGTSGGKAGVGGSANVLDITGNASATIRGDALVKSENAVSVKAENLNQLVSVTEAGGSSDKVGIEGAVSLNVLNNTTLAAIDDDAAVDAGGNVNIEALADIETISVAGGVVATKGPVGIGMSVSLNTINSNVSAFIGDVEGETAAATGHVSTDGNLLVKATSDTEIGAYSVAGALATNSSAQTDTSGASETKEGGESSGSSGSSGAGKGKFGIAISGDASVNEITSNTLAYITDGATVSQAVDATLDATNTLAINALAGAVTISTQGDGNGLSGSYAQNTLAGTTAAYISDATLTLSGDLDVDARVTGDIRTLSASLAGTKGKLGVAGSVSINQIENLTQAYLSAADIVDVNALKLSALDDSSIQSIAGAIAFGGKAGIGLSFAWNSLDNDTAAYVEDSDVDSDGSITVEAATDNSIDTISASMGVSKGNMAGAGAVSYNSITNSTRAYISGKKTADGIDAPGTISVTASDASSIFALAGSLGASTQTAGVGLSFAWSEVANTVTASILNGADVESTAGDVEVQADSTTSIEAIAAGGGVANKVGIAGSVSFVEAKNTVSAGILGASRVVADGNALVTASDDVGIFSLAGNVALGGKAAIGISNSTLITDNDVIATIDGAAQVGAEGNQAADSIYTGKKDGSGNRTKEQVRGVAVTATSHENIETIAAGGAGAGKAGVAGSATVTLLDETTRATIGAGARINQDNAGASASQSVVVRASDETTQLGVAGAVAFGGSAGVGAGADVGIFTKTTEAKIDSTGASQTTVNARNTVLVDARNAEDILSVSASLAAGGSAGVAGSASAYDLTIGTIAQIGPSARVNSNGNVVVSADDATEIDMIAGNAALGGTAGVGASAGVALVNKTTRATIGANAQVNALGNANAVSVADGSYGVSFVDNSGAEGEVSSPDADANGSDSQAIAKQRVASRNTTSLKGVAVTATNKDDIESISATGSIAGTAAATLAGNVSVVTTDTTAEIAAGARINQSNAGAAVDQSVLVAAGNDHYHMGVAGSASGGGTVGIGVGADVLVASHTTRALVGDSADVRARRDVGVVALAQEEILSISAGLGVSGTVGVAGSAAVISIDNTTQAGTGTGSVVDADGNVRIAAADNTETDLIVGTLAIGLGGAGVGGSVGVTSITKVTDAMVGSGATVNARGNNTGTMTAYTGENLTQTEAIKGLSVQATSSEDVFAVSAAGAGGFYAGVSGAVTVQAIDSDTNASIGANADINKGVTDANAVQDVSVVARNDSRMQVITGSLGVGPLGAGVAGAVDVGTFRNDTSASIGDGAEVFARRDIAVSALARADIDSTVVSAAGGIVGVAGAVAVYSVGSGIDSADKSRLQTDEGDVDSYVDDQASDGSIKSLLDGSSDARIQSIGAKSQAKRSGVSISGSIGATAKSGTSATIGDATIDAGRNVDIDARQQVNVGVLTGAAAVGVVGLGVGVGVVGVNGSTQALVAGGASVSAGDDLLITASTSGNSEVEAYVGSGGVVAVDAGVAIIKDNASTIAMISDGAEVTRADDIDIDAIDRRTTRAHAFGASIGAAAAGASVATAAIGGEVKAGIGNNVQIGQGATTVNDLFVTADSETTAESDAEAAKAGLGLAAGGAAATATADAKVSSFIGDGADVKLQDTANVTAIGKIKADASAIGVNASLGASVGASVALASASPVIEATIGKDVVVEADSLTLSAAQAVLGTGTRASATGASGGLLVGANATVAKANANGQVKSEVGDDSTLIVSGITSVSADNDSRQIADAKGFSAGILALGANVAKAESATLTEAVLGDNVKVTGGTLLVSASGEDENRASALAGSGGAISGLASYAGTTSNSETYARTGSGSATRAIEVGFLHIAAEHTTRFNSDVNSTNASLLGASGALAENSVNSRTEAHVGANGYVLADTIAVDASNVLRKDWLSDWNVRSGSGGLFDLPAARSITNTVTNALAAVDAGATVEQTAPGDLRFDAWNDVVARDKVSMDSGGAIAVAKGVSHVLADTNNATVRIGDNATLIGQNDINMGARSIGDVYAQVAVDTYGVAGAPSGESVARFQAVNKVEIGDALVRSEGRDVNIGAGRSSTGAVNDIDATARTDLFNNTAIPINSDPTADAIIATHSVIDIASGADVEAVRHVTLFADKGNANASGVGVGKDIYREALAAVASAVSNAFGGEDVSFETRSGRSIKAQTSDVEVDGSVRVGIHRKLELEIDVDGQVVKASDGISIVDTQFKDVAKDILDRIAALEELIKEYTVSAPGSDAAIAVEAYKSEIRFLERKLKELGFQSAGSGFSSVPKVSERQAAIDAVAGMTTTRSGYQAEVTTLSGQNSTLSTQNTTLATQNATLATQNTTLQTVTIPALQAQIAALHPTNDAAQIASLQQQIANHQGTISANNATIASNNTTIGNNNATITANNTEITRLDGLITGLDGQITQVQAKIDSGTLNDEIPGGPVAQIMTVSNATAQLGNIYVRGDRLHGGGTLDAPGDAEIKITNNSDSFLILQDLIIPPDDGGKLYFNNIDVKSNAQINGINGPSGGAAFSVRTAESNVAPDGTLLTPFKPQILVTSKYDPLDPFYIAIAESKGKAALAPDIVLKGDVSNLRGLVKVDAAAGSIRVEETASISAGQVEIATRNGDFVQSYTNAFSHVAGAPLAYVPGDSNIGSLDRVDATPEVAGKGIIANGSVLIAARYLNINGTVQSGISEWGVSIPDGATLTIPGGSSTATFAQAQAHYNSLSPVQKAVAGSEYYEVTGATVAGLSGNTQGDWQKVTVRYNAKENRLELAGVQVQGGYIELFGQIFNTNSNGGGKLRVLDGYGQIKVDNQSGLDLVINVLDTGRGVQGEINITNITGVNADGTPIVTTTNYTRTPGGPRSDTFSPTSGLRYVITKGTDTVVESFYRYSQSGWFDIDATKSAAVQDRYRINSVTKSNDPLSKGEYLVNWTSDNGANISNNKYHNNSKNYTLSDVITPGDSWKDCNWWTLCANATYYSEYYRTTGTKTVDTYSVKADYPIGIEYIGFDQGTVNVTSNGSVLINGPVNNRIGDTRITSTLGSVTQINDGAIVSGSNVALAANTGIGSASQLVQVNVGTGKLDATSNSGSVYVQQTVGDLRVGTVGGAGVSKVVLDVERNLTGATTGSYVQGKRVELLSRNGAIGDDGTPLTVRTGYSTDMDEWRDLGLQATARDNINIRNVADGSNATYNGNLLLISAESLSGDVRIETSGAVLDNNPFASTDERTISELNEFWDSLRLRGSLADQKAAEQVAAFENGVTQDYRSYWTTRSRQADPSTYDPTFEFKLTDAEKDRFRGAGMTDPQIADFELEKTAQYHALNERLYGATDNTVKGVVNATYDPAFAYHAHADEAAVISNGAKWSDSQLLLSVGAGLLKEITDTVSVIKEPNAKGRNVTLIAGTGIGSFDNPLDIDLTDLNSLTPQQRAALAAAERGDATLMGSVIRIAQPRPVNVAVGSAGALTATTTTGRAFIGSEVDLPLNLVSAPGEIRIKTAGALIDAASVAGAANVIGGNTILEASSGGIGASADAEGNMGGPLRVNLGSGATIVARASDDIWLAETDSDLNVDTLYSRKDIRLDSPGSINDANNDAEVNIRARSLDLHADAGIGAIGNALDVQLDNRLDAAPATDPSGWLTSGSGTGTYLNASGNPLIVRSIDAGTEARVTAGLQGITVDGSIDALAGIDLATQGLLTLTANATIDGAGSAIALSGGGIVTEAGSSIQAGAGALSLTGGLLGSSLGGSIAGTNGVTVSATGSVALAATGTIDSSDTDVGITAGSIVLEGGTLVDAGTGKISLTATAGDITGAGNGAALLYGSDVAFTAQAGAVGTTAAGVVVDAESNVSIEAATGIDYTETAGNLETDLISSSTGDIRVNVAADLLAGNIVTGAGSIGMVVGGNATIDHVSASDTVDILVNGTSLAIDTVDPTTTRMEVTGSGGIIQVASLLTSSSVIAFADNVQLGSVQDTDPSNPLRFTVGGANGGIASNVDIYTYGGPAVVFDRLWADNARVRTNAFDLAFYDNMILSRGVFQNRLYTVDVDNVNKVLHKNDVQLWSGSSPFYLIMGRDPRVQTNALVVDYKDTFIVNEYSSENSFVRLTPKLLSQTERGLEEEEQEKDAAEAPQAEIVNVPEQPLGEDDGLIGSPLDLRASR